MKKYLLITFAFFSIVFTSCKSYEPVAFSGIENINVTSLSQNGIEAIVTARVKNPNKVGFTIYRSEMDISVAGIDAGKVQLDKRVRIKAKSEETYTFKIKSDFSNLSMSDMPRLMNIAMSKHAKIGLKGDLKAGKLFVKKTFPIDITKDVPLSGM